MKNSPAIIFINEIDSIALKCEKVWTFFPHADLTEICQRAAKLAIQVSINADIWAAKREAEDAKMEDGSKEAEDPVPQITRLAFIVITSL